MKCKICANETDNKIYMAKEMFYGIGKEFEYMECGVCGCLQLVHVPDDIIIYYPDDYYSFESGAQAGAIKFKLKNLRDAYIVSGRGLIGKILEKFLPNHPLKAFAGLKLNKEAKILDVGSGAGHLIRSLTNIGFDNAIGIDPFLKGDIYSGQRLLVQKKELSEVCGSWDVVMFNHSLEHMPDQLGVLEKVENILSHDGICLVRVPTVSSYAWKKYRTNWVQLDAPRHMFLHSQESIRILAEKAGLKCLRSYCDSTDFQFWGSEQYMKGVPLTADKSHYVDQRLSMFTPKQIRRFRQKAAELNSMGQGDQIVFVLGKCDPICSLGNDTSVRKYL